MKKGENVANSLEIHVLMFLYGLVVILSCFQKVSIVEGSICKLQYLCRKEF